MKRVIFIATMMVLLIGSACQKEIITPNSNDDRAWPTCGDEGKGTVRGMNSNDPVLDLGDGIVDPDKEEEETTKPGEQTGN